jgi:hypothetical protein
MAGPGSPSAGVRILLTLAIVGAVSGWGAVIVTHRKQIFPRAATSKITPPAAALAAGAAPVRVVFIDTEAHTYDDQAKRSNAVLFAEHIRKDPRLNELMTPIVRIPARGEAGPPEVVRDRPDVIVLNRSAFSSATAEDKDENRLAAFLRSFRTSDVPLLVYSRKKRTDGKYGADLEQRAGLRGRVVIYEFRSGNPFSDPPQVAHFLDTVLLLGYARTGRQAHLHGLEPKPPP